MGADPKDEEKDGSGRVGGGRQQRGDTWAGATMMTPPPHPPSLTLATESAFFDLESATPFAFGGREVVATAADTLISR